MKRKELIKRLRKCGFDGPYAGGKHQFMLKGSLKLRIPNPHGSGEIFIGLIKEIIKQGKISENDFFK